MKLAMIAARLILIGSAQAQTAPEPTIIVLSTHNLTYAKSACETALKFGNNPEGIAECKEWAALTGRFYGLGRRLEFDVMNQMAIKPQCQGVHVFRMNHPDYDSTVNWSEIAKPRAQFHWLLHLDYNPGQKVHGWAMFPEKGNQFVGTIIEGEGTTAQIAEQICIVAKGRGANIH